MLRHHWSVEWQEDWRGGKSVREFETKRAADTFAKGIKKDGAKEVHGPLYKEGAAL